MMAPFDLSTLPKPSVVETLDFEQIVSRQKARFQDAWETVRAAYPDLPPYDVGMLETDPAVIQNESESYRELGLRARVNEAARARLLAFAQGSDLDHLAAFYDVFRLPSETDARLKLRVILAIQGRSTGGPKERYKSIAMAADLKVDNVEVYRIGRSPVIYVAVFSTEANGIASPQLLATVKAALEDESVRLANDEFVISSAVQIAVTLSADIWLLPDADSATVERAKTALLTAWELERGLGRDLVREWWVSKLMISGVHKVVPTNPAADIVAAPSQAISISAVDLTLKGRAY